MPRLPETEKKLQNLLDSIVNCTCTSVLQQSHAVVRISCRDSGMTLNVLELSEESTGSEMMEKPHQMYFWLSS